MEKYLPNGSVVLLKGGKKRVKIYGRRQIQNNTLDEWDYIACLYPEGNIRAEQSFLFQHDQIEKVYFIGFQDEEELEFQQVLKRETAYED